MKEKTLAEQLVKALPEEWLPTISEGNIYLNAYVDWARRILYLDGKRESPWFSDWALDELAKADGVIIVNLGWTDYGWTVTVMFTPSDERETLTVTPKETKTQALVHALVEVLGA